MFLLKDVKLRRVKKPRTVEQPLYRNEYWQINQSEFAMYIEGVGRFYACNGREVDYSPEEEATPESVELYLNGSVYGAILHQRNILPLHGSSFIWNDQGIMLCGESGAGKSSLTAAFCLNDAEFLTDDVTPLEIHEGMPQIIPLSDKIKLWDDSLQQLQQDPECLNTIYPGQLKYYFPMMNGMQNKYPLHRVYIIDVVEDDLVKIDQIEGTNCFVSLRNEIYRWEYLTAMPDTELKYVTKLLAISKKVQVYRVLRPENVPIEEMAGILKSHIKKTSEPLKTVLQNNPQAL